MTAEFYLMPESFVNQGDDKSTVLLKLEQFAEDLTQIRLYNHENIIFCLDAVYDVELFEGVTISTIINNDVGTEIIDRNIQTQLRKIIFEAKTELHTTTEEVIDILLEEDTEEKAHGLLGLNPVTGVPESHLVVYGINDWFTYRRHFLVKYPGNTVFYVGEVAKYMPNLFLHERVSHTMKAIFSDCVGKITFHLAQLNDHFVAFRDQAYPNRSERLKQFSIFSGFKQHATLEGDIIKKPNFTFSFENATGQQVEVCCEPHMKLPYNDKEEKTYGEGRRIYFHEGVADIKNYRILVGHIGDHL